jgi:hypothetical protein
VDPRQKNSQPLPVLEPPIIQPIAQRYTTELSRLLGYAIKTGIKAATQRDDTTNQG